MSKQLFLLIFGLFLFLLSSHSASAGGGAIQPINFKYAEQITGKSFSPEVAVKDPSTSYDTYLEGKEYSIHAKNSLAGATCETIQKISDIQGRIKAHCKADTYGKFEFYALDEQTKEIAALFMVYFTENGTGFSEEGSKGTYTVSISPGSFSAPLNSTSTIEAVLEKNGQVTSDYSEVETFNWQVLEGGYVAKEYGDKQRVLTFINVHEGRVAFRVLAIMKDGSVAESGAIYVNRDNSATPLPSPSIVPVVNPLAEESITPTSVPLIISASDSAEANKQLAEEIEALRKKVAEQEEELNVLQQIVHNLRNFISGLFGQGVGQ